jgi:hypothetical protein
MRRQHVVAFAKTLLNDRAGMCPGEAMGMWANVARCGGAGRISVCRDRLFKFANTGEFKMRIGTVLLAFIACGVLAACQTNSVKPQVNSAILDLSAPRIKCTGHDCAVDVTVALIGNKCTPDPILNIDLATGDTGEKKITWKMATEGYEFSGESFKFGIFIKDNPLNEFKDAKVPGNGQTLTMMFKGNASGNNYRYAITVRKSAGNKDFCETLDPWMIS